MLEYLSVGRWRQAPLFILECGSAVVRTFFAEQLSIAFRYCSLGPSRYNSHRLRIGAASSTAEAGMYDAQISVLGSWKSNAF